MQTATRLQEAGCAGILYKPINLAALREALAGVEFPDAAAASATLEDTDARPTRPALSVVPNHPLDANVIAELRRINSRPDFLARLLAQAETDIENCSAHLLDALAAHNFVGLRAAAHALKGVCANVGAVRLNTLASTLMKMSSEDIAPQGDRLASDVREALRSTLQALRKTVADAGAGSVQDFGLLHPD